MKTSIKAYITFGLLFLLVTFEPSKSAVAVLGEEQAVLSMQQSYDVIKLLIISISIAYIWFNKKIDQL